MSEPYTPAVIHTIRANAGLVPPQQIAAALGWTPTHLQRIADKHGIPLNAQIAQRDDGTPVLATIAPVRLPVRRSELFSPRLRPADAAVIRAKATARFTNPSDIIAMIVEGAIARGKVDEMVSAASFHPRGNPDAKSQVG